MREMGFRIARKHAAKLRRLSALVLFAAPAALMLVAMALAAAPGSLCWLRWSPRCARPLACSSSAGYFSPRRPIHSMIYYDVRV